LKWNSFFDLSFHTFDILKQQGPLLSFFLIRKKREKQVKMIKYQLWKEKKIKFKKNLLSFFSTKRFFAFFDSHNHPKFFQTFLFFLLKVTFFRAGSLWHCILLCEVCANFFEIQTWDFQFSQIQEITKTFLFFSQLY